MEQLIDLVRHFDDHLASFATEHGPWVHLLLFAIIFAETGLVVTPFLPGDSLLFAAGALAARPEMNLSLWLMFVLLTIAAIVGDFVNYHIGQYLGPRIFRGEATTGLVSKLLNRKHLDKAHAFYEKHGGMAVVMGRFVPIVRTFVPFVAGAGAMNYRKFFIYNVAGALLWVGGCLGVGALFGNIPWVKQNFEALVLGIIAVSVLPIGIEIVKSWSAARKAAAVANKSSDAPAASAKE